MAALPGCEFGRPAGEMTLRLAYVGFDGAAALEGVAALDDGAVADAGFLASHCGELMEGVERMAAWLEAL